MRLSGRGNAPWGAAVGDATKRADVDRPVGAGMECDQTGGFLLFSGEVLGPICVAAALRCDQVGGRSQPEFAESAVTAHGNATKRAAKTV